MNSLRLHAERGASYPYILAAFFIVTAGIRMAQDIRCCCLPLTMAVRVGFECFEDTQWIGTLLGNNECFPVHSTESRQPKFL